MFKEHLWGASGGGIGGLLHLKQGTNPYSYLYDGKGNVKALLNNQAQVVATYHYDPFGQLRGWAGGVTQPMQFSTKPYDEKTGMSYYGYRFYVPSLGRWLTRDPLEERGGLNLYGFVRNNPVNFVDHLGLFHYKDGVPPAGALVEEGLRCMDSCLGTDLGISGGGETSGHNVGSKHYTGEAADISFRMNPGLDNKKVMCCAKKCGFGFGLVEGNHYHVQIPAGRGGNQGDLPECECNE